MFLSAIIRHRSFIQGINNQEEISTLDLEEEAEES